MTTLDHGGKSFNYRKYINHGSNANVSKTFRAPVFKYYLFSLAMRVLIVLSLILTLSVNLSAQKSTVVPVSFTNPVVETGFLKNMGQVADFDNKPVDFVLYQANIGGQQVFITNYGLSVLLSKPNKISRVVNKGIKPTQRQSVTDSITVVNYELERIDIVLKRALIDRNNIVTVANKNSPKYNFYVNDPSAKQQQLLGEILIKDVYPGIDWKVYIKQEKGKPASLKYDFIVHPGADASMIQLQYSKNAKLELFQNEIKATAKMGIVKEKKPFCYLREQHTEIPVTYSLKKNTIGFNAPGYNKKETLVIDPDIFWMTYLTSKAQAPAYRAIVGNDIETDTSGNIFVQLSGEANCPFPTVNPGGGAYYQDISAAPNGAMIISKFTPGGQLVWSTYFGNGVSGSHMTIDKYGNIVTVGRLLDPTTTVYDQHSSIPLLNTGGFYDAVQKKFFIAKFSNAGTLLWSSYYFDFSSYPTDMTYDVNGNTYVVGWSEVYDFPVVDPGGGAYTINNAKYGYAQVLFISQFDSSNRLVWSTRIEGNDYDPEARVCVDRKGNIYLGGDARSSNYPLVNAGGYFNPAAWGAVITRFNAARQMNWSTYFPYPFNMADVTTDDSCNLYVIAAGTITKFDSNTNLIFERNLSSSKQYFLDKICYDPNNDQLHILGVMNDYYNGFATKNTICNGSFFNDGISPQTYNSGGGPIFATMSTDGQFSYISLVDWTPEYYDRNEMTVDNEGNAVYLFQYNQNGFSQPNPQLTDPGNGAYFDSLCCYLENNNSSALVLKLTSTDLSATSQITQPTGCNCNGIARIVADCGQAPFRYLWSNGDTTSTSSGLCPGKYTIKITDANNLSKVIRIKIDFPPGSITAVGSSITSENCNLKNGKIEIQSVQGGTWPFNYSLDGQTFQVSPQFTGLDSGGHILEIRDANNCRFKDTLTISKVAGPVNFIYTPKSSSCIASNGQIQVDSVSGGLRPYQYSLNNSAFNSTGLLKDLAPGDYQLTVSDVVGCTFFKTVTVDKATGPGSASLVTSNDHCKQGIGKIEVNAIIGGLAPYDYSFDSVSYSPAIANKFSQGSYSIYIRDANGCVLKKSPIIIENETGATAADLTINHAYCGKLTGDITVNSVKGGSPPYLYSIDNALFYSSPQLAPLQPGRQTVYIKDTYGCVHSEQIIINYKTTPIIKLSPADTTLCYNEQVQLDLTGDVSQLKSVNWNIPSQTVSAALLKATIAKTVVVNITDTNNCVTKVEANIKVKACNSPENCIAIPAAFTPNKDGKNDKLSPMANGCSIEGINFQIYNRYGQLVFETQQLEKGWDGNYKGEQQPSGGYVYQCNYISGGVKLYKRGSFLLIR